MKKAESKSTFYVTADMLAPFSGGCESITRLGTPCTRSAMGLDGTGKRRCCSHHHDHQGVFDANRAATKKAQRAFDLYDELVAAVREARKWPEEDEFGNALDEEIATPGYRAYRQMLRDVLAKVDAQ